MRDVPISQIGVDRSQHQKDDFRHAGRDSEPRDALGLSRP
jgi:hypothetical protein